jgi:hypothetical protein
MQKETTRNAIVHPTTILVHTALPCSSVPSQLLFHTWFFRWLAHRVPAHLQLGPAAHSRVIWFTCDHGKFLVAYGAWLAAHIFLLRPVRNSGKPECEERSLQALESLGRVMEISGSVCRENLAVSKARRSVLSSRDTLRHLPMFPVHPRPDVGRRVESHRERNQKQQKQ